MEAVQVRPPDQPDPVGGSGLAANLAAGKPELPTTDFVTCYQLHYRRLVRALLLAGADRTTAEDVAQDAFARALVHWRRVRRGPNPPGYVYTAGFRLLDKALRRRGRESLPGEATGGTLSTGPDPTGSSATSNAALGGALAAMPDRRRACAVMCLVVGLPVREAGDALGIADGTVRKHLEQARKDLAVVLGTPAG